MEKFGLLGKTLSHSFSPEIHAKLAAYPYNLCEVEENALEAFIRSGEYQGFNVTIPYKKTVMAFCDEISPEAQKIGSINTLLLKGNTLCGYNTDYFGFLYMVKKSGIKIKGKKCLIFGNGGVSLTVKTALEDLGAREIVVISRSGENNYQNLEKHADAEVLVNTTPLGMYPKNGESPVELSRFPSCIGVLDLIYNPFKTKLVLDAERRNIPALGGLYMLVAQAKKAAEIFTGEAISDEKMDEIFEKIKCEKLNLLFIGMPGAGKSYLGKRAAEKFHRPFVDTDKCIEEKAGMPIPKIFETFGEEYFRTLETEVLKEVCKASGTVISTGGGVVTRGENFDLLRQNSTVIWVKRALNSLPINDRPLSKAKSLETLYEERKAAYALLSDYTVENEVK